MATVSPIPTLSVTMQLLANISQCAGTAGILGTPTIPLPLSPTPGVLQNFQNLATLPTGTQACAQCLYEVITLGASGTSTVDMSGAFTNLISSATATFSNCVGLFFMLPTVAQAALYNQTISVQASSVTIGNAASNIFNTFFTGTSIITLAPGNIVGGFFSGVNTTWPVSGTHKSLLYTNLDGGNAATIIAFFLGN